MDGSPATYTQRIALRRRLWWDQPPWTDVRAYPETIHRLREHRTFRHRDDPDDSWKCCAFWPRTLVNKWNGREFAARHGCELAELYWRGTDPVAAPIESLPSQYVVRPVFGTMRRGVLVVVDGEELLRHGPASVSDVRAQLPRSRRLRPRQPFLIEEFVTSDNANRVLPLEVKCHVFGDTVAAVQVISRTGVIGDKQRFYSPAWEPIPDRMNLSVPHDDDVLPSPPWLDQMLASASRIGLAIGTYTRIDFFATDRGGVFNEFSTVPQGGRDFTPYADEFFGALWAERFPDAT
jgi:hypothetical protein